MKDLKPPRPGLTLIELVAALGLSAMFMAVCLTIVGRMSTSGKILLQQKAPHPWTHLLKQQLQRDYMGCRSILVSPNSIRLSGYSSMSGQGFSPSEIEYRIVTVQNSNRVYRTEKSLLQSAGSRRSKDLVCDSIARFRAETALDTDVAPGVFVLGMDVVPSSMPSNAPAPTSGRPQSADSSNLRDKDNLNAGLPSGQLRVVLVRHGGGG